MNSIQSFFSVVSHGGFMMVPLLLSAFIALTIIFERLYLLKKAFAISSEERKELEQKISAKDFTKINSGHSNHPAYAVLKIGIKHYQDSYESMEQVMLHETQRWIPVLEKRLDILDTIITAAPLMGLLGTITGMMSSFQILSQTGVNEPNAVTGGVGEALIATATGLIIALVCLVFFNYFNAVVKAELQCIESLANDLLETKSK